ncbi:tetratricopeptide repeat protein [Candidatus Latescibacterota bacterium]
MAKKRSISSVDNFSGKHISRFPVSVNLLSVLAICILGFVVYSNSFNNSFHFDDFSVITGNDAIRDSGDIPGILNHSFHGKSRFVGFYTFALNYKFHQLDVTGYHITNLLIHLGASLCAWWLALLIFSSPVMRNSEIAQYKKVIALGCGLLFVAHPVQTQAVTYIVQRFASLTAFFSLLALCFFMKARQSKAWGFTTTFYFGAFFFTLLGMFTKETAFMLPFVALLLELSVNRSGGLREIITSRSVLITVVIAIALASVIPVVFILNHNVDYVLETVQSDRHADPLLNSNIYLMTQFRVLMKYIQLLFFPVNLNLDYDFPASRQFLEFPVIASLAVLCLLLVAAFVLFPRRRLISIGIFWFFLTILVESSIKPLKNVIFEHRLYLPLFGYTLVLSSILYHTVGKRNARAALAVFLGILTVYSVGTYRRNSVWQDEYTLWQDVVKKSPEKARPHNNLGNALYRSGNFNLALSEYKKSIDINPGFTDALNNAGNTLFHLGRYDEAIVFFERALKFNFGDIEIHTNLGNAYYLTGRIDEAVEKFVYITTWRGNYINGHINYGEILYNTGKYGEAEASFRTALRLDPENAEVHTQLGNTLLKMQDIDRAIDQYSVAVRLKPDYVKAYHNLGLAYMMKGALNQAVTALTEALRIDPSYEKARINLELALDAQKRKAGKAMPIPAR